MILAKYKSMFSGSGALALTNYSFFANATTTAKLFAVNQNIDKRLE